MNIWIEIRLSPARKRSRLSFDQIDVFVAEMEQYFARGLIRMFVQSSASLFLRNEKKKDYCFL